MEKRKRKNKVFLIVGVTALAFFGVGLIIFSFIGGFLSPQDELEKADAIVTVSGGDTKLRTQEAIKLYEDGWAPYLLFSGAARSGEVSNAASMKRQAIKSGVPEDQILIEEKSTSTYENALFSKSIIEQNNLKKIILVTSPYHQRRAYMNFNYILGKDYRILNHSASDKNWNTRNWSSSKRNLSTTFDELSRVIYLMFTKKYSQEAK